MSDVYLWETYDRLGREALERQDLIQAEEAFRSAVATAEEIQSHDRLVLSLRNLAAVVSDQGGVSQAHDLLQRTLELAHQSLGPEHSQSIECKRDLAGLCRDLGYLDQATGYFTEVLDIERQINALEDIPGTLLSLAQIAQAQEKPEQAVTYYEQVVDLRRAQLGEHHPELAQSLIWLSSARLQAGLSSESEAPMAEAISLLEQQFEDRPQELAQSLMAGAQLMLEAGQLEGALQHQKRALALMQEHLAPEDPKIWEARQLMATSLAGLGNLQEAIELLEYCLHHDEEQDTPQRGALLKNLAGLYLTTQEVEKAEEHYQRASAILKRSLGEDHPAYLALLEEQIQMYHFLNRPKAALQLALRTIAATEHRFGPGHPNTAQVYATTALLAHNAEEWETALELMRAAEKIWGGLQPRPEDVLANCRTNIATCLLRLERFAEADQVLELAALGASPSLRSVIDGLKAQIVTAAEGPRVIPLTALEEDDFELPDVVDEVNQTSQPVLEDFGFSEQLPKVKTGLEKEEEPKPETGSEFGLEEQFPVIPEPELNLQPDAVGETPVLELSDPLEFEPDLDPLFDLEAPLPIQESVESSPAEQDGAGSEAPATEEPPFEELAETESESSEPVLVEDSVGESSPSGSLASDPGQEEEPHGEEPDPEQTQEQFEVEVTPPELESLLTSGQEPTKLPQRPTSPEPVTERRTAPRSSLSLNRLFDLQVASSKGGDSEAFKSFLVDLGPGGIRINSEAPFPQEEELILTLPAELLGQETQLRAEVVWQKPLYGASFIQGLAFLNPTSEQCELLGQRLNPENGSGRANSRQHFRLYRPFPIKVRVEGEDEWTPSYATDLSVNGLGTRLRAPLQRGEGIKVRLELEFELPTVEVEAKVAWSKGGENGISHGLQFGDVGPVEARTIKRYIDRCLEFSPD